MVYLGLPLSRGAAIITGADKKKLTEGKELIRYSLFHVNLQRSNDGRTRNLPEHTQINGIDLRHILRDVEVELSIQEKL